MARCTAHAKRTGKPCRKHARTGYTVCSKHGAGTKARPGGRPIVHGAYSRFLRPEEVVDFLYFREHFDLNDDLAFATTKVYHAVDKVELSQLAGLLHVPSKIALRRKQLLEGLVIKVDIDTAFLDALVTRMLRYVPDPTHQAELRAFLASYSGADAAHPFGPAADA
jgi:hypothetical protein